MVYKRNLDVYRSIDYFETIIGATWLKESLELLKEASGGGVGFGRCIELSSCVVSMAAYYWYKAREELAFADISGREPGLYALRVAALGDDLKALQGGKGLASKVEGLKNPLEAEGVMQELVIASGYARSGRPVIFKNEDRTVCVAGPEVNVLFLVHHHRQPEQGDMLKDGTKCVTTGIPDCRREDSILVVYQYALGQSFICNAGQLDTGQSEVSGHAETGVPVVDYSFIARQGHLGPEIICTGRLAGGWQSIPEHIYIPNEIIMPVRD